MSIKFYAEDLNISIEAAEKISWFMLIAKDMNPKPWSKHSLVRVYFTPWSQNNLSVFKLTKQWFFDVYKNEVFTCGFLYGNYNSYTLRQVLSFGTKNFSGAKTKKRLLEFSEKFYGKDSFKN